MPPIPRPFSEPLNNAAAFFPVSLAAPDALLAGVIQIGLTGEQDLRDRHDRISFADQIVQNRRQCLRRVLAGVMEKNDAAALHLARNPSCDLVRADPFPVEAIHIRNL